MPPSDFATPPSTDLVTSLGLNTLDPGVRKMVDAIATRPDLAERLARMALAFRKPRKRDSIRLAETARRLAPHDRLIAELTEWTIRDQVPLWHFRLVYDEVRNQAYADALERWVEPGMTVFEIGTGTGLLAMLAARAGAAHVYTCEAEPLVAESAREIIARNGLSERITVIGKNATQVRVGEDLPERADLFVAEIVDNLLLGERVLPLTEFARAHLLKPGAPLLPHTVTAMGWLVAEEPRDSRMEEVMGFDLRPFNRFAALTGSTEKGGRNTFPLSDVEELITFDLTREQPRMAAPRTLSLIADAEGIADGLLRWHRLDFGRGVCFENRPPLESAWRPMIHRFRQPRPVALGEQVKIHLIHDRERITIDDVAP